MDKSDWPVAWSKVVLSLSEWDMISLFSSKSLKTWPSLIFGLLYTLSKALVLCLEFCVWPGRLLLSFLKLVFTNRSSWELWGEYYWTVGPQYTPLRMASDFSWATTIPGRDKWVGRGVGMGYRRWLKCTYFIELGFWWGLCGRIVTDSRIGQCIPWSCTLCIDSKKRVFQNIGRVSYWSTLRAFLL